MSCGIVCTAKKLPVASLGVAAALLLPVWPAKVRAADGTLVDGFLPGWKWIYGVLGGGMTK